jgi:hypothetical protein
MRGAANGYAEIILRGMCAVLRSPQLQSLAGAISEYFVQKVLQIVLEL